MGVPAISLWQSLPISYAMLDRIYDSFGLAVCMSLLSKLKPALVVRRAAAPRILDADPCVSTFRVHRFKTTTALTACSCKSAQMCDLRLYFCSKTCHPPIKNSNSRDGFDHTYPSATQPPHGFIKAIWGNHSNEKNMIAPVFRSFMYKRTKIELLFSSS